MTLEAPDYAERLNGRRKALGISFATLARLSGVSEPTAKRILGGQLGEASFANVAAIAVTLGASLGLEELDTDAMCRDQAHRKAEQIARLVQGTSALENQAVDAATYRKLVERSVHELLAGSRRRLWAP